MQTIQRSHLLFKLNLNDIQGSGRDGRILKEDVLRYMEKGPTAPVAETAQPTQGNLLTPLSAHQTTVDAVFLVV